LAILTAGSSLLFVALAIPLMRRRVPPNSLYGLRVPATFADESVWYEANARSGRDLFLLGAALLVVAVLMPAAGIDEAVYLLVWCSLAVAGCVIMAVVGWRRADRLLRERRS